MLAVLSLIATLIWLFPKFRKGSAHHSVLLVFVYMHTSLYCWYQDYIDRSYLPTTLVYCEQMQRCHIEVLKGIIKARKSKGYISHPACFLLCLNKNKVSGFD